MMLQPAFVFIVVKSDSGIESLRDAKVKKTVVFPGTTATNFFEGLLEVARDRSYADRVRADVASEPARRPSVGCRTSSAHA